jgi:hypothetical protein
MKLQVLSCANLSLKADHPPSGFFGFVLSLVAAGVGLAQALGFINLKIKRAFRLRYHVLYTTSMIFFALGKHGLSRSKKRILPLFHYNQTLDVSMICTNLVAR